MTISLSRSEIQSIVEKTDVSRLAQIKNLILFVGHAHSGHSIVGSILDSHSDIALANEVNIAKLIVDHDLTQQEITSVLLYFSFQNSNEKGWKNSEYQYKHDKGFQGETSHPLILGDKKAGGTTRILIKHDWLLNHLIDMFKEKIKFIFVRRNPLDVVAAYSYYMNQPPCQFHVDRYLENYQMVKTISQKVHSNQFIEVSQERFVHEPARVMVPVFEKISIPVQPEQLKQWVSSVRSDIKGKSETIKIPETLRVQLPVF
ncbi:MAG: sulfotransferase [Xanthomonadales bacterium]|nr:sulfotransferase [Xanthomonadales bacterium]